MGSEGGGVAPALSKPMSAESEGVRPAAELQVLECGPVAEIPGRCHEPFEMGTNIEPIQVRLAQSAVEAAECVGRLRGVFGNVCSHRFGCD